MGDSSTDACSRSPRCRRDRTGSQHSRVSRDVSLGRVSLADQVDKPFDGSELVIDESYSPSSSQHCNDNETDSKYRSMLTTTYSYIETINFERALQ